MEEYLQCYTKKLKETDIFPDDFIKNCKNNANEAHFLPLEVKWLRNNDYMHKWL